MANNYNVVDPEKDWSPGQEFVDNVLNRIDNCPDGEDVDRLIAMGKKEAQEYIKKHFEDLKAEIEKYFGDHAKKIEARLKPLKPLVPDGPPTDLQAIIKYIEALIAYFTEPYTGLIEMAKFYSEFSAATATAISAKLAKMPTSIPDVPLPPGV